MRRFCKGFAALTGCLCLSAMLALFPVPPTTAAPTAAQIIHVVLPGDTLYTIGRMYNILPPVIAQVNRLCLQETLRPGQRLVIPGAAAPLRSVSGHVVAPGDTLPGICARYGVSEEAVMKANYMWRRRDLLVGERLTIPGGNVPAPVDSGPAGAPEEPQGISVLDAGSYRAPEIALPPSERWRYIVIHHSATERGSALIFLRAHLRRGFADVGYHFVINNGTVGKRDGQIEVSRRWQRQEIGAHCRAGCMNFKSIGICVVGNFSKGSVSEKQMQSLVRLIRELCARYRIPYSRVIGHRHARGANTECPGDYFPWKELRRRLYQTPAEEPMQ